ncbi:hypothetical protein UA08_09049 [Talaromyces atroroseus]|uniref:Uncharacterized protein n=1 Tax=Talaromyces atroroseus TaxID=1441469 RepID=A0A1Q5Q7F2_TALAT|nr:hypothetical protein UA08_09049 [Talaromyces atroroseus]OKL55703.1 hypothetical protein UA08_09049 [Talaromyces atroroseus]
MTAIIMFHQLMGGAIFMAAGQVAFVNQLINTLHTSVPDIDSALVIATGATELRSVFSPEQMPGILAAFAVAIVAVGLSFFISLFSNFKRIDTDAVQGGGAA